MKKQLLIIITLLFGALLYAQTEEGVVINGVTWATRNVDVSGSFAQTPESPGSLFQWSRVAAWTAEDGEVGKAWQTFPEDQQEWIANNPCPAGWRAPNAKEWDRLLDKQKVKAEWTKQNGVDGVKFTDIENNNSIFLPAAGERDAMKGAFKNAGTIGNYWGYTKSNNAVYGLTFNAKKFQGKRFPDLDAGYSIRCVHAHDSPYLKTESTKLINKEIAPGLKLGDALAKAAKESIDDINKKRQEEEAQAAIKREREEQVEREKAEKRAEAERKMEENRLKAEARRAEQEQFNKIANEKIAANGATVNIKGVNWATKNVEKNGTLVAKQEDKGKYYCWGSKKYVYDNFGDTGYDSGKGMVWEDADSPCPAGYRIPTYEEMKSLSTADSRSFTYNGVQGTLFIDGNNYLFIPNGVYWGVKGMIAPFAFYMEINGSVKVPASVNEVTTAYKRTYTMSIRCVKR